MTPFRGRGHQAGVMLLEALIAILIFSVGILAIVGMQATAIQDMGEAKYRTEAAFLANRIVAEMWGGMGTNAAMVQTNLGAYVYSGSGLPPVMIADWVGTVQDRLPGATEFPPIITLGANNDVTVTVRWRAARDKSEGATAHSYQAVANLNP